MSDAETTHRFIVSAEESHLRLDRFLERHFPRVSRYQLRTAIARQQSRINGAWFTAGWKVRPGDVVEITLGELPPSAMEPEAIPLEILYEDADIAVVHKPAGMVVHPNKFTHTGTLTNALAHHFNPGDVADQPAVRPGLPHRLDRETSGLMVVTRTDTALTRLTIDFHERRIEKRYAAVAHGCLAGEGTIEAPIGREVDDRPRWGVRETGRPAETRYAARRARTSPTLTLLDLIPVTGRTNQLRIHCAHIGHPLVGDCLYGDPAVDAAVGASGRLCLHACALAFTHPVTGKPLTFELPLPPEFTQLLGEA